LDRLPYDPYRDVRTVAKARNKWMHLAAPDAASPESAELALKTAERLFELVEGVSLSIPRGRQVLWSRRFAAE
jgi:tripartite-type tricarboxylate transporter receptor subunit TctC